MTKQSRMVCSVLLASGLLVLGSALDSLAAPPKNRKREPQAVSNAQLREGLHVLQATKRTLEGADHDYGGHRVDAIKAITAAEQQLRLALHSQHKHAKPGSGAGTARRSGAGKQPEPQNISNLQLAESIRVLEQTRAFLAKADHDYGGHRAAAERDIGIAIHQLKVALRFEKKTK